MSKRLLSGINVTGTATLNTVANAGLDTDKFLVLDAAGNIDFRTGDELKIDIGANVVSRIEHEVKLGETMTIGTPVYIGVDLNAGTNMTVYKATNATEAGSSKTIGLIASSGITNDLVEVITEGLLEGLNTSTATKGDPVWLGVNGALLFGLANKPVAPAHMVFLGIVTRVQQNNGEIFVKVQNGFEMNEIHNYLQGSVQNNEVIVYESATSLYKPKSIPTILGYTPADDSLVVKLAGTQTITGAKTFTQNVTLNKGALIDSGYALAWSPNEYVEGSSVSNSLKFATSGLYRLELNSTGIFRLNAYTTNGLLKTSSGNGTFAIATPSTDYVIPSDLSSYVPTTRTLTINGTAYDLSANRSWTITTDASARSILRYVATANQTTFTISGGYTPGLTDVYRNGVKLDNSTDFTATNGTTIVLTNGASVNDVIEVYRYQTAFLANNALRTVTEFIATAGQTTFSVTYNSGLVDVFYNGSKLVSSEFTAGNGTTIVLNFPCNLNDSVAVHAYSYAVGAFTGQAQLNGTGLVRMSGTTVSYDNSTYLTSINSSQVTTALGYTPYNATNPSGYISSYTETDTLATVTGRGSTTTTTISANRFISNATDNGIGEFYFFSGNTNVSNNLTMYTYGNVVYLNTYKDIHIRSNNTGGSGGYINLHGSSIMLGSASAPILHSSSTGVVIKGTARGILELWDATSGKSVFQNVSGDTYIGQLDKGTGTGKTYLLVNGNGAGADIALTLNSNTSAVFNSSVGVGGFGAVYSNLESMRSTFGSTVSLVSFGISDGTYNPRTTISYKTQTGSAYSVVFDSGYSSGWGATNYCFTGGNVGIGTTTPSDLLTLYRNANTDNRLAIYNGTPGYANAIQLRAYDDTGAGYNSIGSYTNGSGQVHWLIGGGATANTMVFYTNNNTERMRLTSGGSLLINTNTFWNQEKLGIQISNSAGWSTVPSMMRLTNYVAGGMTKITFTDSSIIDGIFGMIPVSGASYFVMGFAGNTEQGFKLYQNGNYQFAGSNLSDSRLKNNILKLNVSALDRITKMSPSTYYMNSDSNIKRYGFIAQEIQQIIPDLVTGSEDGYYGVDYNGILTLAVKAIQELKAEIDILKAR